MAIATGDTAVKSLIKKLAILDSPSGAFVCFFRPPPGPGVTANRACSCLMINASVMEHMSLFSPSGHQIVSPQRDRLLTSRTSPVVEV